MMRTRHHLLWGGGARWREMFMLQNEEMDEWEERGIVGRIKEFAMIHQLSLAVPSIDDHKVSPLNCLNPFKK